MRVRAKEGAGCPPAELPADALRALRREGPGALRALVGAGLAPSRSRVIVGIGLVVRRAGGRALSLGSRAEVEQPRRAGQAVVVRAFTGRALRLAVATDWTQGGVSEGELSCRAGPPAILALQEVPRRAFLALADPGARAFRAGAVAGEAQIDAAVRVEIVQAGCLAAAIRPQVVSAPARGAIGCQIILT